MATKDEREAKQRAQMLESQQMQLKAAKRLLKAKKAHSTFLDFVEFMMPEPADPDDSEKSRFDVAPHHRLLAEALEKVERGEILRLIISMPPRHGKSEMCTRMFPAWFLGKDPYRQIALVGASETFAQDEFGRKIRNYVVSPQYLQVFPRASMTRGSKGVGNIVFNEGGNIKSIGKGGQLVGRGADLLVVDDPYANSEEALSDNERKKLWQWFTSDAMSRLMPGGRIIIIHQRWHSDDLTGRIMDPQHPDHDPEIAAKWTHLVIPAVIDSKPLADAFGVVLEKQHDKDVVAQFGEKPIRALWPERFGLKFFAELRRQNPRSFNALYQADPILDEGDYFKAEWLKEYHGPPPRNLRKYSASDHAVSEAQSADSSCFGTVGVDENDEIWVMPDLFWEQAAADKAVDEWIGIMKRHKPMFWWAEKGHISKSIGPFLRKRMREEKTYGAIIEMTPVKDKQTRARSIQGRMAMGMVHFPASAPWWQKARTELLRFPHAKNDDFVDFMSWIGIGLDTQVAAQRTSEPISDRPRSGTLAWVKEGSRRRDRELSMRRAGGF
jgi:predicted phage terminase large subunit-like protein